MRSLRYLGLAVLALVLLPTTASARSAWSVSFGYSSGGYGGSRVGVGIGYGYSYGYGPRFSSSVAYGYGGYGGYGYCPPAYRPAYGYCATPVYYRPVYRPVYYSTPVYYAAPVYRASYDSAPSASYVERPVTTTSIATYRPATSSQPATVAQPAVAKAVPSQPAVAYSSYYAAPRQSTPANHGGYVTAQYASSNAGSGATYKPASATTVSAVKVDNTVQNSTAGGYSSYYRRAK